MISLKDRRVVLVGGAGFIGHHLALALTREGAAVSIIDGLSVNNLLTFASADHDDTKRTLHLGMVTERLHLLREAGVPMYIQDARDERALAERLEQLAPQVIVLLAGISHAQRCNADPGAAFEHTLRTVQYALDAVRESVEHFVYFSSSMVYGHFADGRVTEESPCDPLGIYGALKYAGEKIVIAYHQVFGVPYTIVRPSALYGERCVSRRVVQLFIEEALAGRPLTVHGDGSDRLDFTYIADLVNGVVRLLTQEAALNQVFNLSFGGSRSIGELLELLSRECPGLEVNLQSRGPLTPLRGTLSIDKARETLGFEPQYPLERGLLEYLEWYRTRLEPPRAQPEIVTLPAGRVAISA
jgi:nucleoside-diphosphate-sugar epimerase